MASVLLVGETGVPGENHWHWQTLSHNVVSEYASPWAMFELTMLVVIGTDCIGSCRSNYHTIMTIMALDFMEENNIFDVKVGNTCCNTKQNHTIEDWRLNICTYLFKDVNK